MLNDIYAKLNEKRMADIGDHFEQPPTKRTFRMVINAEIVSAFNFEYDSLFIHYFVELPLGWTATEDSQLCGMTHTCLTTADDDGIDTAHFSHTFSMDLLFDVNRFDLSAESLPKWPQIFFEVVSVDKWMRVRTEGYGFTSMPYDAGCYDMKIDTWRPVLPGPVGDMRR